jgi:hypothetical protein
MKEEMGNNCNNSLLKMGKLIVEIFKNKIKFMKMMGNK